MYDDFHAHLVETNLKIQASNVHKNLMKKVKKEFPYIFTDERKRSEQIHIDEICEGYGFNNLLEMIMLHCTCYERSSKHFKRL